MNLKDSPEIEPIQPAIYLLACMLLVFFSQSPQHVEHTKKLVRVMCHLPPIFASRTRMAQPHNRLGCYPIPRSLRYFHLLPTQRDLRTFRGCFIAFSRYLAPSTMVKDLISPATCQRQSASGNVAPRHRFSWWRLGLWMLPGAAWNDRE